MRKRDKAYETAFGRQVKKFRDERSWSQSQLASQADMSNQQISRIENGKHAVTLHTIKAIAIALGKYPDELLRFEFNIKLNTDFSSATKKAPRIDTTATIIKLVDIGFFDTPKSVSQVVNECLQTYNAKFRSPAISGILRRLVDSKVVKRIKSTHKRGNYLYQKR